MGTRAEVLMLRKRCDFRPHILLICIYNVDLLIVLSPKLLSLHRY